MSGFYVGQKVVLINDVAIPAYGRERLPILHHVYTIRDFHNCELGSGLLLHEIVNTPLKYACGVCEIAFDRHRFRPLEEKPDAIEWARQTCRDVEVEKTNRQKIVAGLREAIEFAKRGVG